MLRVLLLIAVPWGLFSSWLTYDLGADERWLGRLAFGLLVAIYATLVYARRRRVTALRRLRPPGWSAGWQALARPAVRAYVDVASALLGLLITALTIGGGFAIIGFSSRGR